MKANLLRYREKWKEMETEASYTEWDRVEYGQGTLLETANDATTHGQDP